MDQVSGYNQNNNVANSGATPPPQGQQQSTNNPSNVSPQPPQKKSNSLVIVLILLLAVFGIGGVAAAYHFYSLTQEGKTQPVVEEVDEVAVGQSIDDEITVQDDVIESLPPIREDYLYEDRQEKIGEDTEKSENVTLSEINTDGYVTKETLCYKIMIPPDNNAGAENSCDQRYRAYIEVAGSSVLVGSSISTDHRNYGSTQEMVDFWKTNLGGNDYEILSEREIMIDGVPAITVLARADISKLETEFTFIHLPGRYEAYGYPVTGFSILTTYSDFNNIEVQKQALQNLLASWQWL